MGAYSRCLRILNNAVLKGRRLWQKALMTEGAYDRRRLCERMALNRGIMYQSFYSSKKFVHNPCFHSRSDRGKPFLTGIFGLFKEIMLLWLVNRHITYLRWLLTDLYSLIKYSTCIVPTNQRLANALMGLPKKSIYYGIICLEADVCIWDYMVFMKFHWEVKDETLLRENICAWLVIIFRSDVFNRAMGLFSHEREPMTL